MLTKLKKLFISAAAMLTMAAPLAVPAVVYAADANTDPIGNGVCTGVNLDTSDPNCDSDVNGTDANEKINSLLKQVINIFSLIVGIVAVIMIIVGGFKYITSGGDSGNVSSAKNTIIYALVGLVIVALAQFIVKFVLGKATSVTTGG